MEMKGHCAVNLHNAVAVSQEAEWAGVTLSTPNRNVLFCQVEMSYRRFSATRHSPLDALCCIAASRQGFPSAPRLAALTAPDRNAGDLP
jgi:hypothetical protein